MSFKTKMAFTISPFLLALALTGCGSSETTGGNALNNMEFLPVDEAFAYSTTTKDDNTIIASWKIADGYHLYKDKFKFSVSPASHQIAEINYPEAEVFDDPNLGKLESYKNSVAVTIKLASGNSQEAVTLSSVYQGCADVGLCYPPETRKTELKLAQN